MVTLTPRSHIATSHLLRANEDLTSWPAGTTKRVLIMLMSDDRYAVMGMFNEAAGFMDEFYTVVPTLDRLNELFDEIGILAT